MNPGVGFAQAAFVDLGNTVPHSQLKRELTHAYPQPSSLMISHSVFSAEPRALACGEMQAV